MPADTQIAIGVSRLMVDKAIMHLDSHLEDERWLQDNRKLGTAGDRSFAYWVIDGLGMLTDSEKDRVKDAYANKGWRNIIICAPQFCNDDANWSAEFQSMP